MAMLMMQCAAYHLTVRWYVQVFVPPALFAMNEFQDFVDQGLSTISSCDVLLPVALSCFFGLTISFFGFASRKAVSATAYTVIGVTNKLLTILVNVLIWDKHAEGPGVVALLICIYGGYMYQQSLSKPPLQLEDADRETMKLVPSKTSQIV